MSAKYHRVRRTYAIINLLRTLESWGTSSSCCWWTDNFFTIYWWPTSFDVKQQRQICLHPVYKIIYYTWNTKNIKPGCEASNDAPEEKCCLTIPLKSCQSPKFISISFFSSSRLHWDNTRPFILACSGQGTDHAKEQYNQVTRQHRMNCMWNRGFTKSMKKKHNFNSIRLSRDYKDKTMNVIDRRTFLMVEVYWGSMLVSIPSICLTSSHTASVFIELSRTAGGTYTHTHTHT